MIVGLGLIGGSYARGLKQAGYRVGAVTRSADTLGYALDKGWIDEGATSLDASFAANYDIVVLALYPGVLLEWLAANRQFLKKGTLVTDVTGIKCAVVYRAQEILGPGIEFIGAHPMAGREVYGIRNADNAIFKGANYLVTPTPANTTEAIECCEELGRTLGFGRISRLSPEKHDEMIGFLSQLTHCIAVALMTCRDTSNFPEYTGDSFRDLTRIARINADMWTELFLQNREALLEQTDLFIAQMQRIRDAVASGDAQALKQWMTLSTERRTLFDK